MKTLFYILSLALVVASCKKDEPLENETKTYTGTLVANCSMTPMPNASITVFIREPQSFGSNTIIEQYTTDANGNFSFTINLDNGKYVNEIRLGGANITPDGPNSNNMGTIIASPTANFVVKLKVNNPYSVGDTLFIKDFSTMMNVKISAPLSDYTFNTTYNYSSLQNRTLTNKSSVEINSNYSIYNGVLGTSSYNKLHSEFYERLIPACSGMIDTVLIEIN